VIGVFDSGFGGLTVLSRLLARLPEYDYFYLADNARAPYGARSLQMVHAFTREAVETLFALGCPLVILACNTASAQALRTLQQRHLPAHHPEHRILGVVRPSAEALAGLPPGAIPGATEPTDVSGTVAVLGTPGTVASGSYSLELAKLAPDLHVIEHACGLWVPLVEAGELSGAGVDYYLHKYLDPLFQSPQPPQRILLACTHYPLLQPSIESIVGTRAAVISQAETVAERLADWLSRHPEMRARLGRGGSRRFATSDDPAWFRAQGERILGTSMHVERIVLRPWQEGRAIDPAPSHHDRHNAVPQNEPAGEPAARRNPNRTGAAAARDGRRADVAIVGGGVIGSAIAYFLAADETFTGSVVVVERDPSYVTSSTALSAASIRQQFSNPENIEMSNYGAQFIKNVHRYLSVDDDPPTLGFIEAGYLFLATDSGLEVLRRNHQLQRRLGVGVSLLSPDELRQRFDWLHVDDLAAGSLGLSNEGWFDAYMLMMSFRRKARSLGVEYIHAEVTGVDRNGYRAEGICLADGTRVACGTVVNAAGPRAAAIAAMAGIELPVRPRKRFVFVFACHDRLSGCPLIIDPTGVYVRPEGRHYRTPSTST
jgi:glutamate racemase